MGLGQSHWKRVRWAKAPKAHSILRIFGCQTMQNFVYLAELHEPLVEYVKKPRLISVFVCRAVSCN